MALYSCNLSSVGKTTHAAGTAGAHMRYIGRSGAEATVLAQHMPHDPQAARTWMNQQEAADRKNARMIDKIRVALPLELDEAQRAQLVHDYMEEVTQGNRVPWYAAIHQTGHDEHNPHAHIVVRDRSIETGKRVLGFSDAPTAWRKAGREQESAVQYIRERWEHHSNRAYAQAGLDHRIDRRTLEAQGVDRVPQIHEGANGQHINQFKHRPQSQERPETSWRKSYRDTIPYPDIDKGRTRAERNAQILDFNLEKAKRSKDVATALTAQMQKHMAVKERIMTRQHVEMQRRMRAADDQVKSYYANKAQGILDRRASAYEQQKQDDQWRQEQQREATQRRHVIEAAALQDKQGNLRARFLRTLDISGKRRMQEAQDKQRLIEAQRTELKQQEQAIIAAHRLQMQTIKQDHARQLQESNDARALKLSELQEQHSTERSRIAEERQQHEREREAARVQTEQQIKDVKHQQRSTGKEAKAAPRKQAANNNQSIRDDKTMRKTLVPEQQIIRDQMTGKPNREKVMSSGERWEMEAISKGRGDRPTPEQVKQEQQQHYDRQQLSPEPAPERTKVQQSTIEQLREQEEQKRAVQASAEQWYTHPEAGRPFAQQAGQTYDKVQERVAELKAQRGDNAPTITHEVAKEQGGTVKLYEAGNREHEVAQLQATLDTRQLSPENAAREEFSQSLQQAQQHSQEHNRPFAQQPSTQSHDHASLSSREHDRPFSQEPPTQNIEQRASELIEQRDASNENTQQQELSY